MDVYEITATTLFIDMHFFEYTAEKMRDRVLQLLRVGAKDIKVINAKTGKEVLFND